MQLQWVRFFEWLRNAAGIMLVVCLLAFTEKPGTMSDADASFLTVLLFSFLSFGALVALLKKPEEKKK